MKTDAANDHLTADHIIEAENAIRDAVSRSYIDPTGKAFAIYDGVVSPSHYLAAPARILWILKEPWDEDDCTGGGWSIAEHCLNQRPEEMAKGPTFQPIVYTTYGIFNRIWHWGAMPYISAAPEMALLLRSIAFINAKKLPGPRRSNNGQILSAYFASRDIILKQIEVYQPKYVIGCRPHMSAIMADLGATSDSIGTHNSVRYATIGEALFLEVYHPGQSTIGRERYVDDILHVVASRMD